MDGKIRKSITESEFYMWRAVLAFSMTDNVLSVEKQKLLRPYFSTIPFSQTQIDILKNNTKHPQSVRILYHKIANPKDKEHFYELVRDLAWYESTIEKRVADIIKKDPLPVENANDDFLANAGQHYDVNDHHQQYTRTDAMGIFRAPPTVKVSV